MSHEKKQQTAPLLESELNVATGFDKQVATCESLDRRVRFVPFLIQEYSVETYVHLMWQRFFKNEPKNVSETFVLTEYWETFR